MVNNTLPSSLSKDRATDQDVSMLPKCFDRHGGDEYGGNAILRGV